MKTTDKRIYLSPPHMGGDEQVFMAEAFASNWIAPLGAQVDAFERELAEYVGAKGAVALSSGTAGIHLALRMLDIGAGDLVFCSSLTFVASVNPVLYQGATPVLIDSEPLTWNMSPTALRRALQDAKEKNRLPKAVIVVHLYGQSAKMDQIGQLCQEYGVPIIEDAAEALGASYLKKACGTHGAFGVFSFNGNKIITTSGGGMLVSDDVTALERARYLASQAREQAPFYLHRDSGYNYRLSNLLAAVGRGQLRVLEEHIAARRHVFMRYQQTLGQLPGWESMPEDPTGRATRWLSVFTIDETRFGSTVPQVIDALERANIEARRVWKPMHQQPLFAGCLYYPHEEGESVADRLFAQGICLPSGSSLTEEEQQRVIETIRDCQSPSGGEALHAYL